MRARSVVAWVVLLCGGLRPACAAAEVVRVVIDRREDVLDGRPWGEAGAYEKLVGRILFAFDPEHPANAAIVDLDLAPTNGDGSVEAWAEFVALQPKNRSRRRGVAWLEVSNRGGKASLRYFNRATAGGADPTSEAQFGDGLLLRQGLTVIWVGWQWDVPDREGLLRLHVPFARGSDGPIHGLVRADWTVDRAAASLAIAHRGHRAYPPADPGDSLNVLTVRDGREGTRSVVPRDRWAFESAEAGPESVLTTSRKPSLFRSSNRTPLSLPCSSRIGFPLSRCISICSAASRKFKNRTRSPYVFTACSIRSTIWSLRIQPCG